MKKTYHNNLDSAESRALDRFAEMLIDKIESIQGDWKKPWFTEGSLAWPKNLSGRFYNGLNSLTLLMHCEKEGYKIPVFATFDRISKMNYTQDKYGFVSPMSDKEGNPLQKVSINKGERSFPVFLTSFTCVDKETKEKISYQDYQELSKVDKDKYVVYPKLHVYNVFNVASQTNLAESRPEIYQKLVDEYLRPVNEHHEQESFAPLDAMIEKQLWICPIQPTYGDNAYYSISKNVIVIPERRQFSSGESYAGTVIHEMTHSTGGKDYFDRLKPAAFNSDDYAKEELIAEMGAALVCQRYGMTKYVKSDSLPYLKGWLQTLKEDPSFLKTVLNDVKKATHMITQKFDAIQLQLNQGTLEQELQEIQPHSLKEIGQFDIPEWSLNYLVNGDSTSLTDEEVNMVDEFVKEHFPNGYVMEVDDDNSNELNPYPAFGLRNENALTNRGESPYLATKTFSVKFYETVKQVESLNEDVDEESVAAKERFKGQEQDTVSNEEISHRRMHR